MRERKFHLYVIFLLDLGQLIPPSSMSERGTHKTRKESHTKEIPFDSTDADGVVENIFLPFFLLHPATSTIGERIFTMMPLLLLLAFTWKREAYSENESIPAVRSSNWVGGGGRLIAHGRVE
jgi:hypothetical protein